MEHAYEPSVVFGGHATGTYLAACTCDWVGLRYRDESDAQKATAAHIEQPQRLPGQEG